MQMELDVEKILSALIILLFLTGIVFFRDPRRARLGNWINMAAYAGAVALVIIIYPLLNPLIAILGVLIGGIAGSILAMRVNMLEVPQVIAFQHGCGGIAAFLIAFAELVNEGRSMGGQAAAAAVMGIMVGAATFSGSLVAAGKLARKIKQTPVLIKGHSVVLAGIAGLTLLSGSLTVLRSGEPEAIILETVVIVSAVLVGTLITLRVGGADMPVIISFFSATAGLAAAFCGIAMGNYLLIGCGACVGASGSLLTLAMCRAMKRSFFSILSGSNTRTVPASGPASEESITRLKTASLDSIVEVIKNAMNVIIVPGYGMALSQAQETVHALEKWFEKQGAAVCYAIHPVAGRMPGHMNVLLAEAGVDYDKLVEMQDINHNFRKADLAIIIGACDVVNPAATSKEGTPISGMPVLSIQDAGSVVVFNFDSKPGFSGVDNPLYEMEKTSCIWGDARTNLESLLNKLGWYS